MSETSTRGDTALYLYGIVRAGDAALMGPMGLDVDGAPERVYPIVVGAAGAVVSRFPGTRRVAPTRRNLGAHNRVLLELMSTPGSVLPLRFGHVLPGEDAAREFLAARQEEIARALSRIEGKVEVALKVYWDVENVFDYLVKQDAALCAARDELFAGGREPSRDERLDLGRMFAARLDDQRRTNGERVIEGLGEVVAESAEDPAQGEKMVVNLALLVERARLPELYAKIHEIAGWFPDVLLFKYAGPFAPFHFVAPDLDDERAEAS
jgi:Gas vesicle synthesis protein GvpL/GvpF